MNWIKTINWYKAAFVLIMFLVVTGMLELWNLRAFLSFLLGIGAILFADDIYSFIKKTNGNDIN